MSNVKDKDIKDMNDMNDMNDMSKVNNKSSISNINDNNFTPFFINLKSKNILVIGAGKIAYRKIKFILECGGNVTIISDRIKEKEKFNQLFKKCNINVKMHEISLDPAMLETQLHNLDVDISNYFMVIAATDCSNLNNTIYKYCDNRNILVNNITSKGDMNLRFCKFFKGDNFKIGISGDGDPSIAKATMNKFIMFLKMEKDKDKE